MIRTEIISVDISAIRLALYYPVPAAAYLPGSADASRVPAGAGLSAQEAQHLKDGRIIEVVKNVSPQGKTQQDIRTEVEGAWEAERRSAIQAYKRDYSYAGLEAYVGKTWDGSKWS